MQPFEYLEPASPADACRMLADRDGRARVLAGGTDLIIQTQAGRYQPEAMLFLGKLPELREIRFDPRAGLTVGAMTTMREIELHPVIQARYPVLARGAAEVGSVQILNLATLGGNMCNASPSADTSPSLLVLDDLGAEQSSSWVRERLYVIVSRRHNHLKPTIFTSNYDLQETGRRLAGNDDVRAHRSSSATTSATSRVDTIPIGRAL